jgi:hypothetical protein
MGSRVYSTPLPFQAEREVKNESTTINSSAYRNRNNVGYHFSLSLSLVEKRVKMTPPNGQR